MAMLSFTHELFGRFNVYATTSGVTDLPSAGGPFQVGDLVLNFSGTSNAVAIWICTTASPSPKWSEWGVAQNRTAASPVTISAADSLVLVSSAGTEVLPAATSWPTGQPVTIKNTAGTSITITPVSGTIDGLVSSTLATLTQGTYTTDGTVYWKIGS